MSNIVCNPLNLEYRYQLQRDGGDWIVSREGADPTMLLWKDTYLLFVSVSGGFWYSDDLISWEFKETPELPIYEYAPDVHVVDGKVYWSASNYMKTQMYVSEDPLHIPFRPVEKAVGKWWDPALFQDDDGRVYFYQGSSVDPITGVELDPETMKPIGKPVPLAGSDAQNRGWERVGENNVMPPKVKPSTLKEKWFSLFVKEGAYVEGAFMTKREGKYYLQYATPGTQYNVYSDGVFVSDAPLGPFTYQRHNPFSSVPGGFMTSAGHGSTFQDKNGKWWHIATMLIGVNEKFERRLGIFPCNFDKDGVMWCEQDLADYPFDMTTGKKTGWMLLDGTMSASTSQPGCNPEKANDENVRTCWAAQKAGEDQWLQMDLGEIKIVHAIQVNFADYKLKAPYPMPKDIYKNVMGERKIYVQPRTTQYLLEGSVDGETWICLKAHAEGDHSHDFTVLDSPMELRYLRLRSMILPFGGVPAVSGLRVFGKGNADKPQRVTSARFRKKGDLNIILTWDAAEGATRYNVRYGIDPKKLYSAWQVRENRLDFSFVNKGETYFAVIDSINENGITSSPVFRLGK